MYYTNSVKITMNTTEAATKALKVMRSRLSEGLDCNDGYKYAPSQTLSEALAMDETAIILPEDFGCLVPNDAEPVFIDLLKNLAETLREEAFACEICNVSDYDEGWIAAKYESGVLTVNTTFFPCGYMEYLCCEECGEDVVRIDEYEAGKTYVCPECGEVIDLSGEYKENRPQIAEKIFLIA